MPRSRLHARQLGSVASRARTSIRAFAHEIMRGMAALARDARVELLVVGRALVTRAAIPHSHARLSTGRMRVVAADARSDPALLRMVRVLVGVAARASLIGATQYVVRRVAARALAMARGVTGAEHRQIFVAGPASNGLVLTESMGLVTTDAGHVTTVEQRGRRYDRLRLLMTRHARGQRLRAGGVLLLVAGRANLVRRLARDGVRRLDVLVAVLARTRLRRRIFVRPMTIEALAGVVDLHGRRERLARAVTVQAVTRLMRMQLLVLSEALQ